MYVYVQYKILDGNTIDTSTLINLITSIEIIWIYIQLIKWKKFKMSFMKKIFKKKCISDFFFFTTDEIQQKNRSVRGRYLNQIQNLRDFK